MGRCLVVFFTVFFCVAAAFPQTAEKSDSLNVDAGAAETADRFLKAVKIVDLPEGQQLINETCWDGLMEFPQMSEATTLFEGMFDTDLPGIKGYKRLSEIKVLSKAGISLTKRYLLVEYRDRHVNKWKVLGFTEGVDLSHEVSASLSFLNDPAMPLSKQNRYRLYAHWLLMSGQINAAEKNFQEAANLNMAHPAMGPYEDQPSYDHKVEIIRRIKGE